MNESKTGKGLPVRFVGKYPRAAEGRQRFPQQTDSCDVTHEETALAYSLHRSPVTFGLRL